MSDHNQLVLTEANNDVRHVATLATLASLAAPTATDPRGDASRCYITLSGEQDNSLGATAEWMIPWAAGLEHHPGANFVGDQTWQVCSDDVADTSVVDVLYLTDAGVTGTQSVTLAGQTPQDFPINFRTALRWWDTDTSVEHGNIYLFAKDIMSGVTGGVPDDDEDITGLMIDHDNLGEIFQFNLPVGTTLYPLRLRTYSNTNGSWDVEVRTEGTANNGNSIVNVVVTTDQHDIDLHHVMAVTTLASHNQLFITAHDVSGSGSVYRAHLDMFFLLSS